MLGFAPRQDQRINELGIAQSSGYPLLDDKAMSILKMPVPTPPFILSASKTNTDNVIRLKI